MKARPNSDETVLGLTAALVVLALTCLVWAGFRELLGYAENVHDMQTREMLVPRR